MTSCSECAVSLPLTLIPRVKKLPFSPKSSTRIERLTITGAYYSNLSQNFCVVKKIQGQYIFESTFSYPYHVFAWLHALHIQLDPTGISTAGIVVSKTALEEQRQLNPDHSGYLNRRDHKTTTRPSTSVDLGLPWQDLELSVLGSNRWLPGCTLLELLQRGTLALFLYLSGRTWSNSDWHDLTPTDALI